MRTITVICRERHDTYPDPLIYAVEVNDPSNLAEVEAACVKQRLIDLDLSEDDADDVVVDALFVFEGDLTPIADWRA